MIRMAKVLDMFNVDKGQIIELNKAEKKHIFFLKQGTVKIIDTRTNTIKYVVNKGSIFGELALFDLYSDQHEQAVALEDSILCAMAADKMLDTMKKYPFLKNNIIKAYGARIKKLEQRLSEILSKDSATRIHNFINDYVSEFGEQKDNMITARNLLSHKDIANLTNTSRQTVSNVLSSLRKQGIIDYDKHTISLYLINVDKQVAIS